MKSKLKIIGLLILAFSCFQNDCISQCYYSQPTNFWAKGKSTGLADLDNVINNENVLLQAVFGVKIDLYVGGDEVNQENAMFAQGCGYQNCEGEIWLGLNLMSSLFQKTHGLERLKAVFAHEYAHALQNKWGFAGYGKYPELHADFLAGYYTGVKGTVSSELLESFVKEFYSMGDFNFFSASHHGTGTERGCAFVEGYKIATVNHYNTYQAYLAGIDYVRLNNPCISFKSTKQYEVTPANSVSNLPKGSLSIIGNRKRTCRIFSQNNQLLATVSQGQSYDAENLPQGQYFVKTNTYFKLFGWSRTADIVFTINEDTKTNIQIKKIGLLGGMSLGYSFTSLPKSQQYYSDGYDAFKANDFKKALEKLNKEIEIHPANYNAFFFRAISKSELGDRQGALDDYKIILSHNDEILKPVFLIGTLYNNIGYSYLELKDFANAEKYIKIALESNPYEYYIWASSGELNYLTGNYDQSVKDFTKSIELRKDKISRAQGFGENGFEYYYRGLAYLKLKKHKLACSDLTKAKELGYSKAETEILNNCSKK